MSTESVILHRDYPAPPDQIVDVTIDPQGSGSRVTVIHSGLETQEMCGIITGGWTAGLAQLGTALETEKVMR
jgi:hypothetical protein